MSVNLGAVPYAGYSFQNYSNNKVTDFKGNLNANTEKQKSSTTKKVVGGLALASTVALAIYALKTGKLAQLKNIIKNPNSAAGNVQNEAVNTAKNSIDDVIKAYSERAKCALGADSAPIIKNLKNGKTAIEFKGTNNKRAFIVCDKNGKVEKLIEFWDGKKNYTVYDGIDPHKSNFLKEYNSILNESGMKKIFIEKPIDVKKIENAADYADFDKSKFPNARMYKQIFSQSNDKVSSVLNTNWHTTPLQAEGFKIFRIYKNGKKPANVIKEIGDKKFYYKAGNASSAQQVDDISKYITPQQEANMKELFNTNTKKA